MTDNLSHLQAVFAENTSDGVLMLLELTSQQLQGALRFVNDRGTGVLNVGGNNFIRYPFSIKLPDRSDRGISPLRLVIDNVDAQIGQAIEQITQEIKADVKVVRLEAPSETLYQFVNFVLRNVTVDLLQVRGDLEFRSGLQSTFPNSAINPSQFPGLGRGF